MADTKPQVRGGKRGLAAAVALIIASVFALEGGYVNHPSDPGGATNHGITERVARANGYRGHMRDLPKELASKIYQRQYIEKPNFLPLIAIDPVVAEEIIDTGVNMGPRRPSRFFQRSLNRLCGTKLAVDGRIGRITIGAWAECRAHIGPTICRKMIADLDRQQRAEYERLIRRNPKLKAFRRGWLNHRIGNVDARRCGEEAV
ncbi:MAG: glycosyl hydrolase 108 family protein [Pseudomonadota bacterium]